MWIINDLTELLILMKRYNQLKKRLFIKWEKLEKQRSKETGNHVKRVAEYQNY